MRIPAPLLSMIVPSHQEQREAAVSMEVLVHLETLASCHSMLLTIRFATLSVEGLTLKVYLTSRAIEAFRMPVLVEGLHPAIARLNGELATIALSLEHGVPILLAVDVAVL